MRHALLNSSILKWLYKNARDKGASLEQLLAVSSRLQGLEALKLSFMTITSTEYQAMLQFMRITDIPSQQRLRSSTTDSLFVTAVRLSFLLLDVAPFPLSCMYTERYTFAHHLLTIVAYIYPKQWLKCTYFVSPTRVLPFNCSSPLWSL